jgi:broad specificity phosphatase PhoE
MAPARIMFIRHAEKPMDGGDDGVSAKGKPDPESLTPRGWQRAGALARFFWPLSPAGGDALLTPAIVFAAGTGAGSKSKRPMETVSPLVALLTETRPRPFVTKHLKDDHQQLIDDVLGRDGVVLVCWEHELIPSLIALIPKAPAVPQAWAGDRFDLVWILDAAPAGWRFSQRPQLLLAGDRPDPIV